jgi:hypothetical protein
MLGACLLLFTREVGVLVWSFRKTTLISRLVVIESDVS